MGKKEWNDPKLEVLDIKLTLAKHPGKPHESHGDPKPEHPGFS